MTYCNYYYDGSGGIGTSIFSSMLAYWSIGDSQVNGISFYFNNSSEKGIRVVGNVFKNDKDRMSFDSCFYYCSKLTSIPTGLFDNCPNVTSFSYCFNGCSGVIGSLPPLWIFYYEKNATKSRCLAGCINASNWEEVPASWGGPGPEYVPPANTLRSGAILADYRALDARLAKIEEQLNLRQ